ncbi:hypothetical protein TNCV_3246171 [Trichonephila clavipes]|nr:hypothetical protein TNCV_3246171 [Trichonephila clavipes]
MSSASLADSFHSSSCTKNGIFLPLVFSALTWLIAVKPFPLGMLLSIPSAFDLLMKFHVPVQLLSLFPLFMEDLDITLSSSSFSSPADFYSAGKLNHLILFCSHFSRTGSGRNSSLPVDKATSP